MAATPWAILLCKFKDDTSADSITRERLAEIFTSAGNGKNNMVDYFRDISHGYLDLSGSKLFPSEGWYTLARDRSDYQGAATPGGRNTLITWAKDAAAEKNDSLAGFFNVVVVTNTDADLFGGPAGAVTAPIVAGGISSVSPSVMGQEMAHGWGLQHSRIAGSSADYMDRFDIMSTKTNVLMADHPHYPERGARGDLIYRIGPGLNAATMHAYGWLDADRVWQPWKMNQSGTFAVRLRPLHRPDLPGFLGARLGGYFVEFRMNESWDAQFPSPLVLIHTFGDGHSYLQLADDGRDFLVAGSTFSDGDVSDRPMFQHDPGLRITVDAIDADTRTATVKIEIWTGPPRPVAGPATVLFGVENDAGGLIIVNGKITKVPPHSPLMGLIAQITEIQTGAALTNRIARRTAQEGAYRAIAHLAQTEADRADAVGQPAETAPYGDREVATEE